MDMCAFIFGNLGMYNPRQVLQHALLHLWKLYLIKEESLVIILTRMRGM